MWATRRQVISALATITASGFLGVSFQERPVSASAAQVTAQPSPQGVPMAETVFKNVQVLKGIPVDEFLDTMGMFAAATTKDCSGCHAPEVVIGNREAFARQTPMIQRARQMVGMVNTINQNYFGGARRVTCYTCHSATAVPTRVPNLAIQYGTPLPDNPNAMEVIPAQGRADQVGQIFARYLQVIGGSQRLSELRSFTAAGTYAGWDTSKVEVPVEFFGRGPDQFTTIVHRNDGDNVWVFDGRNAWFAGVDATEPNFVLSYTGGNLQGARVEALVFISPQLIQQSFARWQVSEALIDDNAVTVLQGSNPGQTPVNFFFDESGLLVRVVRWSDTAVGPVPTQYDFSDYRDVGGTRRPFQWVKTWTNNRVVVALKDLRQNATIDAARFARPTAVRRNN